LRLAFFLFGTLSYPVFSILETRQNLKLLRRTHPGAGLADALRMYGLALAGNVPPVEYVLYGFEDAARRREWPQYLYWTDSDALKMLNRLRGADPRDVQDKARFARICTGYGLPHVAVLGEFGPARPSPDNSWEQGLEPDAEVWVKPLSLQGGVGAECWRRKGGGYEAQDGQRLTGAEFLAHLSKRPCVLQRRLHNHPEVDSITNGWLATLRIVTALGRDGRTELLGNGLGLPSGKSMTASAGLTCSVGWEDGVIFRTADPALINRAAAPDICHPDTGVLLLGRKVPFWLESLELVQAAHRTAFPKFATLGWDVALTPDGPLLLETNSGWGALSLQIVFQPLGRTALTQMIAEELPR
jgi:hypothetical protein